MESSTSDPDNMLTIWASTDAEDPDTLKLMVTNLNDHVCNAASNIDGFLPVSGEYYRLTNTDPLSGYSLTIGRAPNEALMPSVNGYQNRHNADGRDHCCQHPVHGRCNHYPFGYFLDDSKRNLDYSNKLC